LANAYRNYDHASVSWTAWGKIASDADILDAARDLLLLPDGEAEKILAYLEMFWQRPFPLEPGRLIAWATHIDNGPFWGEGVPPSARIPLWALNALKNVNHPDVRHLALDMIASSRQVGRAVSLFASNYQDGDWQFIKGLTRKSFDRIEYDLLVNLHNRIGTDVNWLA
jgi:hypothetical protein